MKSSSKIPVVLPPVVARAPFASLSPIFPHIVVAPAAPEVVAQVGVLQPLLIPIPIPVAPAEDTPVAPALVLAATPKPAEPPVVTPATELHPLIYIAYIERQDTRYYYNPTQEGNPFINQKTKTPLSAATVGGRLKNNIQFAPGNYFYADRACSCCQHQTFFDIDLGPTKKSTKGKNPMRAEVLKCSNRECASGYTYEAALALPQYDPAKAPVPPATPAITEPTASTVTVTPAITTSSLSEGFIHERFDLDLIYPSKNAETRPYKQIDVPGNDIHAKMKKAHEAYVNLGVYGKGNCIFASIGFVISDRPISNNSSVGRKFVSVFIEGKKSLQFALSPLTDQKKREDFANNLATSASLHFEFSNNSSSRKGKGSIAARSALPPTPDRPGSSSQHSQGRTPIENITQSEAGRRYNSQTDAHSETLYYESLMYNESLMKQVLTDLVLKMFPGTKDKNISSLRGYKIHAVVMDMHSTYQMCAHCARKTLSFIKNRGSEQISFINVLEKLFATYGIKTPKRLDGDESGVKAIVRYSASYPYTERPAKECFKDKTYAETNLKTVARELAIIEQTQAPLAGSPPVRFLHFKSGGTSGEGVSSNSTTPKY